MRAAGNAGLRFLIALALVSLALVVEYAFTDGGVLRWVLGASAAPAPVASMPAPAPTPIEPADPRPAVPAPPPRPARSMPAATIVPAAAALPFDSSFEDGNDGWSFDARGGDGIGARTGDAAHDGSFALFSQASSAANRGWPGWEGSARYAVTSGATYVFRAYAASPDGGNAWLGIQLHDAAGTWLGGRSTGCARERPRRGAWELLELRYVNDNPRVATVALELLHCLNHSAGRATTVYFDDASFALAAP